MEDKEKIAIKALDYVENNSVVGLGTGSTANYFIKHLSRRIEQENLNISVVASSTATEIEANKYSLNLLGFDTLEGLDLYVDGADEISPQLDLLKGKGYDLVKEKLLAQSAEKFIVIADSSKKVKFIGENNHIPIEVLKDSWRLTKNLLDQLGNGDLRKNAKGDAYSISSAGNYIFDYKFKEKNIKLLHDSLLVIPGVAEIGIFHNIADNALIINNGDIEIISLNK
jgi:ribose 5-phosphate isomerase A